MATLQRLDILAKGRLKTEAVQLENGDEIIISEMGAVDNYALFNDPRFRSDNSAPGALLGAALLVRCIVDGEGQRLFTNEDESFISGINKGLFDQLLSVAMRLNGMGESAHDETLKNSEPSPA